MDDKTWREFVTIHVREGAWQVVMLFRDELICRDSRNNDKDTVSGDLKSRKLTWWPTQEDQALRILCKVLTEEASKLDSLHLSECELTDEGVKDIVEALSYNHCHLNSLSLRRNYRITDKGVKHIAEALSNGRCHLNSLNLSGCKVTDEGVKHIAEALCNIHCPLNSLQLKWCKVSNEGATHLAEVLKDSKYKLKWFSNLLIEVTAEGKEQVSEEGLS